MLDNKPELAMTLFQWGLAAQDARQFDEAVQHFRKAIAIWQGLRNPVETARCYERIGSIALEQKDADDAWRSYRQALQMLVGNEVNAVTLRVLLGIARVLIVREQGAQALALLAFLLHYPGCPEDVQDLAEPLIFRLETDLPPADVENAWDVGKTSDLGTIVAQLLV